jgi:hypothetical protein
MARVGRERNLQRIGHHQPHIPTPVLRRDGDTFESRKTRPESDDLDFPAELSLFQNREDWAVEEVDGLAIDPVRLFAAASVVEKHDVVEEGLSYIIKETENRKKKERKKKWKKEKREKRKKKKEKRKKKRE